MFPHQALSTELSSSCQVPAHLPDTAATMDLRPQVKTLILLVVNAEFQDHSAYKSDWSENIFLEENYT